MKRFDPHSPRGSRGHRAAALHRLPLAVLLLTTGLPAVPAHAAQVIEQGEEVILTDEQIRVAATTRALRRTVHWLTSPDRKGRRAGTQGELDSALWLAGRLRDYHLVAEGDDEYLQPFPVPLPVSDGGDSWVAGLHRFEGPESLVPLDSSAPGKAEGPLVFCGLGIEDPQRGWSDYPDDLPEGAIVLIVDGDPEGAARTNLFDRVAAAAARGAAGVLVAPLPRERTTGGPDDPEEAGGSESAEFLRPFRPGLRGPVPAARISERVARALYPDFARKAREARARPRTEPGDAGDEVEMFLNVERGSGIAYNVLARIEGGEGPTVMLGAYFDHLGNGGLGSLAPDEEGTLHPGADSNASGVAVLIEVATALLDRGPPPGDVVFAFWSGHCSGSFGSRHWTAQPSLPLEDIAAYIDLADLGRLDGGDLRARGAGSCPAFAAALEQAGAASELAVDVELGGDGLAGTDAWSFLAREIPGLHLSGAPHGEQRTPADGLPGFQSNGAVRAHDLVLDLLARLQGQGQLPFRALDSGTGDSGGEWRVDLGIQFDEIPKGDAVEGGVRIRTISENGSAVHSGLLPGDVLLHLGDVAVAEASFQDEVRRLYRPGDVVLVHFRRGEHERRLRMTLFPEQ